MSTEGIWRFVLDEPLDTSLSESRQVRALLRDSRLTECNQAMARLLGRGDASSLLGARLGNFIDASDPGDGGLLRDFIQGGHRMSAAEYQRRDRHGRMRYFVVNFTGDVVDERLLGGWGTLQDITRLKEAEAALRISEGLYRVLAESSPLGIWHVDARGRTVYANPAMCRMLGVDTWEQLGDASYTSFMDTASIEVVQEQDERRRQGERSNYEVNLLGADGVTREVFVAGAPIFDDAGALIGTMGTFVDLTDRRRAEAELKESESRFHLVAEQTGELLYDYNLAEGTIAWHGAITRIMGYTPAEMAAFNIDAWMDHVHPDDRDAVLEALRRAQAEQKEFHTEYRFRTRDGEYRHIEDRGAFLSGKQGQAVRMLGTMSDVTERKQIQRRLQVAANALESMVEGMVIQDADLKIVQVNRAFSAITGYRPEDVLGSNADCLYSNRQDEHVRRRVRERVRQRGYWRGEVWYRRKTGEVYPALLSVSTAHNEKGELTHYISVFSDISQYKHYEERLTFLAHHDPLTGLPNRSMFQDRLRQAIARAQRNAAQCAVLFIDLDHFKTINDSLGHSVGDELLKQVAQKLKDCVRESDTVARLGGDEFTILLDEIREDASAGVVAEKVIAALRAPFLHAGNELFTAASIGISVFPSNGRDVAALLKNADAAMYQAKKAGRNTYRYFSHEMSSEAVENLVMANSLRQALENEQFTLYYQPFVHLESGHVTGVEALLRWKHPELGITEPGRFISVAEDMGIIDQIGEWVLESACRQLQAWRERGRDPVRMSVNLSARQFKQPNLVTQILRVLERTGTVPNQVTLEITESMLMENPTATARMLSRLSDVGIYIAIDDFGTGYSSLGYLKHFPIHYLKIDKSFVQGLPHDPDDVAITRTIIAMASSLDIRVIAEGVESEAQRRFLMDEGCRLGQGFLFVRPVTAKALTPVLGARALTI